MSERVLRQDIVALLKDLDAISVENPAYPGTPDVNFIEGWIEAKQLARWPSGEGNVLIRHFTLQQRVWLRRRWLKGGSAMMVLRVGRSWTILDGETAALYVGRCPKVTLLGLARYHWKSKPSKEEFQKAVLSIRPRTRKKR